MLLLFLSPVAASCCCMAAPAVHLTCTQWAACCTMWQRVGACSQVSCLPSCPRTLLYTLGWPGVLMLGAKYRLMRCKSQMLPELPEGGLHACMLS
jgi:hypothetical protein